MGLCRHIRVSPTPTHLRLHIVLPLRYPRQASLSDAQKKAAELGSTRKKLNFTEGGAGGAGGGGGGEGGGGKGGTPTLHRGGGSVGSGTQPREQQSGYVSLQRTYVVLTC